MTLQPPLSEVLGAGWGLGSAVQAVAWSGGCAAFALADGTVALGPAPWAGAPSVRQRDGRTELVPAQGEPRPLVRVAVSRGPCLALASWGVGFLVGCSDGRLRRVDPDGAAEKVAKFEAPVERVVALRNGWACLAGGLLHGGPGVDLPDALPPQATELAAHPSAGLAVVTAGGVALCRGPDVLLLEGGGGSAPPVFSPDGGWLAGAALWRTAPGAPVALPGLPGPLRAAAFSADSTVLAGFGAEGLRVWQLGADRGAWAPVPGGDAFGRDIAAFAFHPRRALLAVAYGTGAVTLGRPGMPGALLLRAAGPDPARALAFAPAGEWLALGTAGGGCEIVALPDVLFRDGTTADRAEKAA